MKKIICALLIGGVAACGPMDRNADEKVAAATKQAMGTLEASVGLPRITNWTEARLMNRIYELRDQPNLATFTYRSDINGQLHCIGRSIGFGLPYAAQRSNPERVLGGWDTSNEYRDSSTIPQPEPNGLFMPDSATATWVLLIGPNGQPSPVYIEDEVTISPFPLQNVATQCRAA